MESNMNEEEILIEELSKIINRFSFEFSLTENQVIGCLEEIKINILDNKQIKLILGDDILG